MKLNDFFAKEGIKITDFAPATVLGYAEWPKGTPNYWALPAMGDALGWTYRKDWFAKPELQAEFKKKYNRDLAAPKTWTEFKHVAEFFTGKPDRRQEGLRHLPVHRARLRRHHDGREQRALPVSASSTRTRRSRTRWTASSTGPTRSRALEFYKALYKCCTPPGLTNSYMGEGLDAFKSGQVAMMMNWFAFFPGLYKDPNVGGDKIGFFVNPSDKTKGSQLGGQGISVVAYSPNRAEALAYIKWFATPDVQKKWWALGGYSCHKAVLNDPGFKKSAPFAGEFLTAMDQVVDFWAEPSYAQLLLAEQKRIHDYVVADKGTAKEALDGLLADWKKVFKEDGKMK